MTSQNSLLKDKTSNNMTIQSMFKLGNQKKADSDFKLYLRFCQENIPEMNYGNVEKQKAEMIARTKWEAMALPEKKVYLDYFSKGEKASQKKTEQVAEV